MKKIVAITILFASSLASAQLIGKTTSTLTTNFCKKYLCKEVEANNNVYLDIRRVNLTKKNAYIMLMRSEKKLVNAYLYFLGEFESPDGLAFANEFIYEFAGIFIKTENLKACFRRAYKDLPENTVATLMQPNGTRLQVSCVKQFGEPLAVLVY